MGWITWAGLRTELRPVDCIVVLGARSLADGTPGPSLQARCARGVQLWHDKWAPVLVFTGGRGASGSVEGEVGLRYARAHGVPDSALYYEGGSHNTYENFLYASQLMRARGWHRCLVVTDPFHEPRSLALARNAGLEAYPAPTFEGPGWRNWSSWTFYTLRESVSWMKYTLVDR
jgi:uncharacterized SAM-binding protein YcdF (DUF218 family)